MKRLKVLVSAYACEPGKGSEPGVGWNWVRQIARFHDVWVVTRANNRAMIEKALAKEPMPNVHWRYFDLPRWARFWKKGQRGVHLYYYLWQIGAYFVGRHLHREVSFDLVHHVTFVKYWIPSFLSFLPVPFIWGPVGGGESAPGTFFWTFSCQGRAYEFLRSLARWLGEHDPFVRLTAKRARLILATTPETQTRIAMLGGRRIEVLSEVGLPEDEFVALGAIPIRYENPFRVASIGRLLHLKGFHLGLIAFANFHRHFPASEYWLFGDGPERRNLELLVRRLSIFEAVKFWGQLPRGEVLEKLADCDVLVHPSLHDSGGWVCVEAMAAGRPVICLDLGGPGVQVSEEAGFKVFANTPEQAIRDMAWSMARLAESFELRLSMGMAGRRRVEEQFTSNKKGEWLGVAYQKLLRRYSEDEGCGQRA